MIALARTVGAILERARPAEAVRRVDLRRGDRLLVATQNSVYSIRVLEDLTFSIRGGWFDRQGLSPVRISIAGCTWGGTVIKSDLVAARGLYLEFGNRVVTSRIREVHLIRGAAPDSLGLVPADSRELLLACYGPHHQVSANG